MLMKRLLKSSGGFTLVEMTVVIAIIAVLAALALPAVTGVTTTTRGTSKTGDQKEVEQSVSRYEADNPDSLPSTNTLAGITSLVKDVDGDGVIKINVVDSNGAADGDIAIATQNIDVVCSDTTAVLALAQCFGAISFTTLTPSYLTTSPAHPADFVTGNLIATGTIDGTVAGVWDDQDFQIENCNLAGDTCVFYLSSTMNLTGALRVWNIAEATDSSDAAKVGNVFTFAADANYGTNP